ncbi:hypothetical protein EYR38_009943 [Pleurotus pulmonarius]|nr:hypothetical protein EYR38_009943 [Pleurotus pulmonarius]
MSSLAPAFAPTPSPDCCGSGDSKLKTKHYVPPSASIASEARPSLTPPLRSDAPAVCGYTDDEGSCEGWLSAPSDEIRNRPPSFIDALTLMG